MLGALVGDAAGAPLEFCRRTITEQMAVSAMKMPGGGPINVGPGQITDDGELILALWSALKFPEDSNYLLTIARNYSKWYLSMPFDIGQTCSQAFEEAINMLPDLTRLQEHVLSMNGESEANGALMRATAIATWAASTGHDALHAANVAKEDAKLSHPSVVCQEANAVYVFAITYLLNGRSPQDSLELVNRYVSTVTSEKV